MLKPKKLLYFIPSVIWMFCVFILSTEPLNDIPIKLFKGADKIVHFLFYALMIFLIVWAYVKINQFNLSKLLFAAYWSLLFGSIIELIQHYLIKGRTGDWWDIFANTIGILFMSYILYKKHLTKVKRK